MVVVELRPVAQEQDLLLIVYSLDDNRADKVVGVADFDDVLEAVAEVLDEEVGEELEREVVFGRINASFELGHLVGFGDQNRECATLVHLLDLVVDRLVF